MKLLITGTTGFVGHKLMAVICSGSRCSISSKCNPGDDKADGRGK